MADYYVREEDGTSKYVLEDSSGDYLLEAQTTVSPAFIASATVVYALALSPAEEFPGFISSATIVRAPTLGFSGEALITTAGTYQWLCPAGVTAIFVECIGAGSGGATYGGNGGAAGGGGGAYAARNSVPVTPGTLYTFVVGAAGSPGGSGGGDGTAGGQSSFTGDSGTVVIAVGGSHATDSGGNPIVGGVGGLAASSTGDIGRVFSGGSGGNGVAAGTSGGGGGGASGNRVTTGNSGAGNTGSAGGTGGAGANGGGSGGHGGTYNTSDAVAGSAPGGGGGGGGGFADGRAGADGHVFIVPAIVPAFIASVTVVHPPVLTSPRVDVPFIASVTIVHAPTVTPQLHVPFISSHTVVYTPSLPEINAPFISSRTHVWNIFSQFDPNRTFAGPGNGGEGFLIRLAANGTSETATLAGNISSTDTALDLTGDGGLPSTVPFVVTIDDEVIYIVQLALGSYRIRGRGVSNTAAASHTAGATVTWGDSYDMAIRAGSAIANAFTANINSTGSFTYPGWLICFDSTQAYDHTGARYPMHVTQMLGVFDAHAGSSGSNRCDGPQPSAIHTATGASDDCPAALTNPARIAADINVGDVAVLRYTNPEATVLDLGGRSTALESWFGLKRVSTSDTDVTFTDPNGIVVDTTGTYDTFTGSVNGQWADPVPLVTGIAPDASDLAGSPIPTPNPVAWTTVTLDHTDRLFTLGSGSGGYDEEGWPMCCLAVRQGNRRVPLWQSWDWHNYAYVYDGFGADCTYAQILINRNGIVFDSVPSVDLPGNQDIDGPDAVWDDGTYFFGASWYVVIFSGPYIVFGPGIGGTVPPIGSGAGGGFAPGVDFGGSSSPGPPAITLPPTVEGGEGGDITPGRVSLFQAAAV